MDFTEMILEDLKKKGEYNLGSLSFKSEGDGVSLRFKRKEKIPENLLPGIDEETLQRANPPKIDVNSIIDKTIEVREDSKAAFSLYRKGDLKTSLVSLKTSIQRVQEIYDKSASHITRMFGSYILILKDGENLKAVYATPPPIMYCPLMYKLLKEIGGDVADKLLEALKNNQKSEAQELMMSLINDVVIAGGGFDDNRPLNSCERNVTFGASEIMADAMQDDRLDASVIVSNNLGTVVTTSSNTTQGVVKRMSGLFYTTPSPSVVENAFKENIMPVFPFTGEINQVEGLKQAIKMGHKKISVSVAANDNYHLKELSDFEKDGLTIYKFALCATGVNDETAEIMANNADIVWSCASKPVREKIAPRALAQVGIKIPIYIMTKRGWNLVKPRINAIDNTFDTNKIELSKGNNMPIVYNNLVGLSLMPLKQLDKKCVDCPDPCI